MDATHTTQADGAAIPGELHAEEIGGCSCGAKFYSHEDADRHEEECPLPEPSENGGLLVVDDVLEIARENEIPVGDPEGELDPLELAHAETVAIERQVDEEAKRYESGLNDGRGLHRDPPRSERSRALMILPEQRAADERVLREAVSAANSSAIGALVDEIESNVPAFALRFLNLEQQVRRQMDMIQSIELFLGGATV